MIHIQVPLLTFDVQKIMARLGQEILDQVKLNIKNGVNNNGESFIPYSPKYAAQKGRSMPDLHVTGRLLSSLKVIFRRSEVVIGVFGDRNQVAEYLNQHKNWSFLTWGSTLDKIFVRIMEEEFVKVFNGGQ